VLNEMTNGLKQFVFVLLATLSAPIVTRNDVAIGLVVGC
jgi:hypothetical protein